MQACAQMDHVGCEEDLALCKPLGEELLHCEGGTIRENLTEDLVGDLEESEVRLALDLESLLAKVPSEVAGVFNEGIVQHGEEGGGVTNRSAGSVEGCEGVLDSGEGTLQGLQVTL